MEQCLDTTWMGMSPEAGTCLTEEISPSCCATVFIKVVEKIRLHQAVYEVMLVSLPIKSRVFKSNVSKPAINIRDFRIVGITRTFGAIRVVGCIFRVSSFPGIDSGDHHH